MGAVEVAGSPRVVAFDHLENHSADSPHETLKRVAERLRSLLQTVGWDTVPGVGVGAAGLVRRDTGTVVFSPNLPGWEKAPVGKILERELGLPVRVDNDVNVFSLAEWMWGAGDRSPHAVFLTLGTGIGGGVVAEGKLLRGHCGFAGEPGHATLVLDGTECPCGNRGCAERYVGNRELVDAARRHPGFDSDPILSASQLGSPLDLSQAAERGSPVARGVLAEAGRALGGLLVTLVNIFNPERVVIGGGVAQAGPLILDPARQHLARHSLVARHAPPRILAAALGERAGLLGAAGLLLDESYPTER
jgi:glucokinase